LSGTDCALPWALSDEIRVNVAARRAARLALKNRTFALTYVFSSLVSQALYGGGTYSYTPGNPWSSYNAEQQASIVEDWFRGGMPASDPLYPYITDHVRTGNA
jgi:hypothetical protein